MIALSFVVVSRRFISHFLMGHFAIGGLMHEASVRVVRTSAEKTFDVILNEISQ